MSARWLLSRAAHLRCAMRPGGCWRADLRSAPLGLGGGRLRQRWHRSRLKQGRQFRRCQRLVQGSQMRRWWRQHQRRQRRQRQERSTVRKRGRLVQWSAQLAARTRGQKTRASRSCMCRRFRRQRCSRRSPPQSFSCGRRETPTKKTAENQACQNARQAHISCGSRGCRVAHSATSAPVKCGVWTSPPPGLDPNELSLSL